MNIKQKITLACFLLALLPMVSYAESADYVRRIKNESNTTWIILDRPVNRNTKIYFDAAPKRGKAVCGRGSVLTEGPCFLPPGETTFVKFVGTNQYPHGELIFIDGVSSVANVDYKGHFSGISVTSKDGRQVHEADGDLSIFRN